MTHNPNQTLLCFLIHLFDSKGMLPRTMDDVTKRKKDIIFSSRYAQVIEMQEEIHCLKNAIHYLSGHVSQVKRKRKDIKECLDRGWNKNVALVRYLYEGKKDDLASKDFEFSQKSILEHMIQGLKDGRKSIKQSPWLNPFPKDKGIMLYDVSTKGKKLRSNI